MAKGDVINQILGSSNTTFQPASGVEIMVLRNFGGSPAAWEYGITDGTNSARAYTDYNNGYDKSSHGNKFGITNTIYYTNTSNTSTKGFSGIQTK